MLARKKLNCSFLSKDGGDVISDLFEKFVKPTEPGKESCFYRFVVFFSLSTAFVVINRPSHGFRLTPS